MRQAFKVKWMSEPEENDYPAAEAFLTLLYLPRHAADLVKRLRKASKAMFEAKDILRATGHTLDAARVEEECEKILAGKKLSPILLVRDTGHLRLIVADGFHRLCAVYKLDDKAVIPCRIV